jgi:hypothetical protein
MTDTVFIIVMVAFAMGYAVSPLIEIAAWYFHSVREQSELDKDNSNENK